MQHKSAVQRSQREFDLVKMSETESTVIVKNVLHFEWEQPQIKTFKTVCGCQCTGSDSSSVSR